MAKAKAADAAQMYRKIAEDVGRGVFSPVYLLMGEEPYYPDKACDTIMAAALDDSERDFNQTVFFGIDSDADSIASEARSYPMMAERRLVVLKEAQSMKTLEGLSAYCENPTDSTVLVILMHGAAADKRKALYKTVSKTGVVLESPAMREYEMPGWIDSYYRSRGLRIAPDAASLLAEFAGTDMGRIVVETDKMLKNLPEGTTEITAAHIERNVGISRQFNVFELTKALAHRNSAEALRIAAYLGEQPKFAVPPATAAIFNQFFRILRYEALLAQNPRPNASEKAAVLGVVPYFFGEYDAAVRNYPPAKCMKIISLIEKADYRGKGGDGDAASPAGILTELVTSILDC
jgi:DNA polymerase III subunit delta